jgi:SAM-dependent methyltransferase
MRASLPTAVRRVLQHRSAVLRRQWHLGVCPVCEGLTVFLILGEALRNDYRCARCWSVPRRRALTLVLNERVPHWRDARVHEFGPAPEGVEWFRRRCASYSYSHFWPDIPRGAERGGVRCEDLGQLTYPNDEFDVVVSQDVFEHLPDPAAAAAEVARVLAPGGTHVFTVPILPRPTVIRAAQEADGSIHHLLEPHYHGNPADASGALVFREWGPDIVDFVQHASGLPTELLTLTDRRRGIVGAVLDVDVMVSTKPD